MRFRLFGLALLIVSADSMIAADTSMQLDVPIVTQFGNNNPPAPDPCPPPRSKTCDGKGQHDDHDCRGN